MNTDYGKQMAEKIRDSKKAKALHDEAMFMCDKALMSKRKKDDRTYFNMLGVALKLEKKAADMAEDAFTRSVLFKSAANMARECGKNQEADTLENKAAKASQLA